MPRKKATDVERLYKEFLTAKAAKATGKITHDEFREVSARYRYAVAVERASKGGGTTAVPEPIAARAGVNDVGA